MAEEQYSGLKKPSTVVKPLPVRVSANVALLGAASSFQQWKKPFGFGFAEGSSSGTKPFHQAENENKQKLSTDPISEEEEKLKIGGGGGGDVSDDNTAKTDEGQAYQPEMDPRKLRRIIANRISAQKSRLKKNAYVADLESRAKFYQNNNALLYREIAAQKKGRQLLQIEQHKLKLRMAASEKQRILQEEAIEKNRAEVDRLKKLQSTKLAADQAQAARMLNLGASVHPMSNFNLNHSGLGRLLSQNYYSDQEMQVDTAQQSQNQSQMMRIANWENRKRSFPNFNI